MALPNTGTDVPEPTPPADAGSQTDAAADAAASAGADAPKIYTEEVHNAVKEESISRKAKIDALTAEKADLVGEADALKIKVSKLAAIVSGDESADADIDPTELAEQFKAQTQQLEQSMETSLLKGTFMEKASKMGFQDSEIVFKMIDKNDPRLKVSLVTQSVEGLEEVLTDLVKEAPWIVKSDDADGKGKKPAPSSVAAPGAPPPSGQTGSENKDALDNLKKEAEKLIETKGTNFAANWYLNEKQKLEAK